MAGHYETLLAGVAADPDRRLSELPLLSAGGDGSSSWAGTAGTEAFPAGGLPARPLRGPGGDAGPDADGGRSARTRA